jgi:hypothetical protein
VRLSSGSRAPLRGPWRSKEIAGSRTTTRHLRESPFRALRARGKATARRSGRSVQAVSRDQRRQLERLGDRHPVDLAGGHLGEDEVVVLKRPAEDGSRVALRGRRCSSPGAETAIPTLRHPRKPPNVGVTPDLRGSPVSDVIPRIDPSRGWTPSSRVQWPQTLSAGERRSRRPGSVPRRFGLHCWQDRCGRSSGLKPCASLAKYRCPFPSFADDFTRLRDGEPRRSEKTLSQASRKAGNAQCPARRGETRSEPAGSLPIVTFSPAVASVASRFSC